MSDQENLSNESENQMPTELDMLKSRARMMGITFSNAIGVDALKKKIDEKLNGTSSEEPQTVTGIFSEAGNTEIAPADVEPKEEKVDNSPMGVRKRMLAENMKLVRIRYTNMNPHKKDLPGEFFTVANEIIGRVTKFIPYTEASENGWHVPYCIYKMMKGKKYLQIRTNQKKGSEQIDVQQKMVNEFAIEVLPPLTPQDITKLAASQAAANATAD